MSILTGYAISTGVLRTDHTYVKSDNPPFVWSCWGRGSGGKRICRGSGNSSVANCISQSNSHAGIIYGVTGVCHQTANRILYPARVTVSKARGYWASSLAYGTYGTTFPEFLVRLATCNSLAGSVSRSKTSVNPLKMDMGVQSNSKDDLEKAYIQKVVDVYTEQMQIPHSFNSTIMKKESSPLQRKELEFLNPAIVNGENSSLLGKELELMMEFRLGRNLDSQTTKSVLKQQSDFLKEKGGMDRGLYSADLNIEKYVKEVNDLFGDMLTSLPEILGKDKYEKIFDLAPLKERFVLIDSDIAVKAHERL